MTKKLQDLMQGRGASDAYRLPGRTGANTIARTVEAAAWQFLHLDGADVTSKAAFLKAAGAALKFPQWAGHNWDAFEELLNDLSWLSEGQGIVLLIDGLSSFARAEPEQLRTAVEILTAAARNRQQNGERPLIVLLRGAGTVAAPLAAVEVDRR